MEKPPVFTSSIAESSVTDGAKLLEVRVDKLSLFEKREQPKISLTYGDAVHEFKKCRGQDLSKSFEETFVCKVDQGIDFLEVGLWDSHRFTSDKLVGSAKVQLHNATSENFHHFTTMLLSDNRRSVGEVQLKIRLVEPSMLHSMPLLPNGIPSARIEERIGDLYEFNLESGNTLLKDIDLYISMKYGDVVYKTKKSTGGDFVYRFVCKVDEAIKVLDVDLWKRCRIFPPKLVSSAMIELDNVTSGDFHHIKTQLFSKNKRYVGELGLKVRRVKPNDVNYHLKITTKKNFHMKTYYKRGNCFNCTKQ